MSIAPLAFCIFLVLVPIWALDLQRRLDSRFEYAYFRTEPSIRAPIISFPNFPKDNSSIQPGYFFLEPKDGHTNTGLGPLMYDTWGNFVWDGTTVLSKESWRTQNTHICDFMGESNSAICITERWDLIEQHNVQRIFNSSYQQIGIGNYGPTGHFNTADQHEFIMADKGRRFLRLVYKDKKVHPTKNGLTNPAIESVLDGCLQEVDVETGKETFAWCGGEYMDFKFSNLAQEVDPWDFMHVNSADKNEEGDYLLSVRYYNQILKIAGPNAREVHGIDPGSVIWRLGGNLSDFAFENLDDRWSLQHDARFIETKKNETLLTLFDNHNLGLAGFRNGWDDDYVSRGRLVRVNNETMTVKVLQTWRHPYEHYCENTGSMRLLPNGNAFLGWGDNPAFSEFAADGKLLLHGNYARPGVTKAYNYRIVKDPWVGNPPWDPILLPYSQKTEGTKLVCYVSWHGSTKVKSWRFSVSKDKISWTVADTFKKDGFETTAILYEPGKSKDAAFGFMPYVSVEALDENDTVLAEVANRTFVPRPGVIRYNECNEDGCQYPPFFKYKDIFTLGFPVSVSPTQLILGFALAMLVTEPYIYMWHFLTLWFDSLLVPWNPLARKYEALKPITI